MNATNTVNAVTWSTPQLLILAILAAAVTMFLGVVTRQRISWVLWCASVGPLLVVNMKYAVIGIKPFFLPDVLAALALCSTAPVWLPRLLAERRLRGFRIVAFFLAVMAVQAVVRGLAAGYPDALKGAILGLYPVEAALATIWLLTRSREALLRLRWVAYLPVLGVVWYALGLGTVPAATGLYLSLSAAAGLAMRRLGDSRLLFCTLVGALVVTAVTDKRGPVLAVAGAIVATVIAVRSAKGRVRQAPVFGWAFVTFLLVVSANLGMVGGSTSDIPVVGGLVSRVQAGFSDANSEAANNVEVRYAGWAWALHHANQNPILGVGAGKSIDPLYDNSYDPTDQDKRSGPHNSFIGYIYYLGWPAGLAFAWLVLAALVRTWRVRANAVGAMWFGATVGVVAVAFFNVAFEVTYIGLPSWLVLAFAYARLGIPDPELDELEAEARQRVGTPLGPIREPVGGADAGAAPGPEPGVSASPVSLGARAGTTGGGGLD
jgi:hypothetical protein